MKLKLQWNALRRGDTVFVHDASDADLGLRAGVVTLVDVRPSGHEVGIRFTTGTRTGSVVRPGRFAVHLAAMQDHDCWRCSDNRPQRPAIGLAPAGAPSGSVRAVAVLSTPASMTAEQQFRISEHLDVSRTGPPPGRRFHACFGHGDHLMRFDVWDSPEEFDALTATLTATLKPMLAIEDIDMAPPEPPSIHDLLDRGDPRALRKTIAELRDKAVFIRPPSREAP